MSPSPESFAAAVAALAAGKPVLVPTDTLFGIAVCPAHAASPDVLYQIKGRPSDKPVAWLVSRESDLELFGRDVPAYAKVLAAAFWPGALTLVVRASEAVPKAFRSAAGTIGLRMPDDALVRALADELGFPLAVTSANRSGQSDPHSFEEIDARIVSQVACALDDAVRKSGVGSTVLDCTADSYRILREGDISRADIEAALRAQNVKPI